MQLLITYDVSTISIEGQRRLRQISKVCLDYGQRVQNSVFECQINPTQFVFLKKQLLDIIREDEDSLRFYNLGKEWDQRVEHYGIKKSWNPNSPLIL